MAFACIEKPRRGYYHATISLGVEDASSLPEGELTRRYVRYLEAVIRRNPDMWLWTHKRWKHSWKNEYAGTVKWVDEQAQPHPVPVVE